MIEKSYLDGKIIVKVSDITDEDVDVIVNAANSSLMGGGGVDGSIHRAGGIEILNECKKIRTTRYIDGLPTGEVVITTAGKMKARSVIHTVGPVYSGKESDKTFLHRCYFNSLELCRNKKYSSIAFPAISTGVYGYPKDEAAVIASSAIKDFLHNDDFIKEIRLVFFSQSDAEIFIKNNAF